MGAGRSCAVAAGRGQGCQLPSEEEAGGSVRRRGRGPEACGGSGCGGRAMGAPGYGATRAGGGGRHRSAAAEPGRAGMRLRGHRGGLRGFVKSDVEINYSLIEVSARPGRPGARCVTRGQAHSLVEPR